MSLTTISNDPTPTTKTITITLDSEALALLTEYKRRYYKSYNHALSEDPNEELEWEEFLLIHAARMQMRTENERPEPEEGEGVRAVEAMWKMVYPNAE